MYKALSIKQNNTGYRKDWQAHDKCCLDLSLHNRYQTGAYLAETIDWINTRFTSCLLNLGDTLHRHNLKYQYRNAEKAHNTSRKLGDKWISENENLFNNFDIPYKLMRSNDWLADPDFEPLHEKLWSFYYADPSFRKIIKDDIETFVTRRTDIPASAIREASLYYLLEETAADILLGQRGGLAHLYPGKRHRCYAHLVERTDDLPADLRGLENSAFKRLSPSRLAKMPQHIPEQNLTKKKDSKAA